MKRLSFSLVLVFFITAGYIRAQEGELQPIINYNALENKLKKSNSSIEDPKKNIKVKTWMSRGELLLEIYLVNLQFLRNEMTSSEVKIFFREPDKIEEKQDGETKIEKYIYERITFTFENDKLTDWVETVKITEDPLGDAGKAFDKVIELDTEGKYSEELKVNLDKLRLDFESEAVYYFSRNEYEKSLNSFKEILRINEIEVMGNIIDTVIFYNVGRVSYELENHKDAIEYFEIAKKLNHDEEFLYKFLYNSYIATGDSASGLQTLKDGFERYPENSTILIELINYYLMRSESEKALEYLSIAKNEDPDNVSFYFAEGSLLDKLGKFEEAKSSYEQCILIDDTYFNAYYNLGVMYYNEAVVLYEEANTILDNEKYKVARKIADEELAKSVPYMEQAHVINPDDIETLRTLKTLYYRLKIDEKYDEVMKKLEEKGEKGEKGEDKRQEDL